MSVFACRLANAQREAEKAGKKAKESALKMKNKKQNMDRARTTPNSPSMAMACESPRCVDDNHQLYCLK
jgi:hypothetical protein